MIWSSEAKSRYLKRYGPWALVTGASTGIGYALAEDLARAGFNLIICSRKLEGLQSASTKLATFGVQLYPIQLDLSQPDGVNTLLARCSHLDIGLLVNNAGVGTSGFFSEADLQEEQALIRLNIEAVVQLSFYFAKRFKERGRGGLIFLSSVVAFQGVPRSANYAASKAYVQSFSEALYEELKPFGVDVLTAIPGPVESNFAQRARMQLSQTEKPEAISLLILKALGCKAQIAPGFKSALAVYSLRSLPRFVRVNVMKGIMAGFTKWS